MRDRVDARLTAAFHEVPVPDGLAQRLVERLATERELSSARSPSDGDRTSHSNGRPEGTGRLNRRFRRRRALLIGAGGLATAGVLLLAAWISARDEQRRSEQLVIDEAIRALDLPSEPVGRLLSEMAAPKAYPLSAMVRCLGATRWRQLDGFLGRNGVLYELPGAAGERAVLYVIERDTDGLAASPALQPFAAAGYCASAWQEGGLLYILVVQGDAAAYESHLNLPRSPVA